MKANLTARTLIILSIISLILIVLSMLFSISESSFLALNKLRLRVLYKKKQKRAIRVFRLLEKKDTLINTLLVANDIVNILLSAILTAIALKIFGSRGVGIATFVATILLLIFGEITPKTLSTRNPDNIAYSLSLFVSVVVKILRPFVAIFTFVSRVVLKIMRINVEKEKVSYTEEDIKSFIDASGEEGVIENGEKNMMNQVFKFTDLTAQEIMVPRLDIVAFPETVSISEILETAKKTRYSYFPIYKTTIDDITGVLYLKDLLKYRNFASENSAETFSVKAIMRPPLFVPGTNKMSSVQELLRENNQSFAIVIDEYSGTDGILTKENIYFQIFGDKTNLKPFRSKEILNNFVDGNTLLTDVEATLNIKLPSEINETIGGYITEKLGRLANENDKITESGYTFTVETVQNRRIEKIKITEEAKRST